MRCVADFDTENHALKFWGFLKQKGIDSSLEKGDAESKGSCQIWVLDEDQLSLAFSYLNEFKSNPDDPKFSTAPKKDKIEEAPPKKRGFKEFNLREKWQKTDRSSGTMTLSLIITCVAVFLLSGMGKNTELVGGFFISEKLDGRLSEVSSGQIWRLFTPFSYILISYMFYLICFGFMILAGRLRKGKGRNSLYLSSSSLHWFQTLHNLFYRARHLAGCLEWFMGYLVMYGSKPV